VTGVASVDVAGARVGLIEASPAAGGGVPVLLLHGLAGRAAVWDDVLARIAPDRRAIAIDLAGHGDSDAAPPGPGGIAAQAAIAAGVLDALGVARAVWIGNSLGGHVALHAALELRDRVAGLVLVNATGAHPRAELAAFLRDLAGFRARAGAAEHHSLLDASLPLMFHDPASPASRRFLERARAEAGSDGAARRVRAALHAIIASRDATLAERLDEVAVPTLVVWGERDRLLDPGNRDRLATIPGAETVDLAATGHMPHVETPAAFVAAIAPFLARLDRD